jgi:hypothetical protein
MTRLIAANAVGVLLAAGGAYATENPLNPAPGDASADPNGGN